MKISGFFPLLVCSAALLAGASVLAAQDNRARIDIGSNAKDPFNLEITGTSAGGYAEWLGGNWQQIVAHFPTTPEWQEASVTFKPQKSGRVSVSVSGPWQLDDPATRRMKVILMDFDDLRVTGATLENGGFEETNSNGDLTRWYAVSIPGSNPPVSAENRARLIGGDAAEGTSFVRVWHNSRFGQTISVTADQPVTLTFRYRLSK